MLVVEDLLLLFEHGKVLGIFPTTWWPTASVDHELTVRRALTSALVDGRAPEPRDRALIAASTVSGSG